MSNIVFFGVFWCAERQGGRTIIILSAAHIHPPLHPSMLHPQPDWKAPWQPPGSGVGQKGCFYLLMRSVPGALSLCTSFSQRLPPCRQRQGVVKGLMNACQVTPMPSSLISAPASKLRILSSVWGAGWVGGVDPHWAPHCREDNKRLQNCFSQVWLLFVS